MSIRRSIFLKFGLGFFGFIALILTLPRQFIGSQTKSCNTKKAKLSGDASDHKFTKAFTNQKFNDLPKNPVKY